MKNGCQVTRQQGMTLIEIMIALIIGAFLLGGVLQIFASSSQTFRMQDNLSRLQENGRFAMDFISRDIRMADNWGCLSQGLDMISNEAKFGITNALIGTEGVSDAITVIGANGGSVAVTAQTQTLIADPITVAAGNDFEAGDVVLISDCEGADFFTIGGVTDGTILSQDISGGQDVTKIYGTDATVSHAENQVETTVYFIQNGALWRTVSGVTNELVGGIENMQILYGEDTNGDSTADYYVPSTSVTDMSQVVSIRVGLLAVTADDNLATQPVTYTFNGTDTTPADRRLRRVFSSTIAVRNRLP